MFPILNLRRMFVFVPVKFPVRVKTDDASIKKFFDFYLLSIYKLFFIDRYMFILIKKSPKSDGSNYLGQTIASKNMGTPIKYIQQALQIVVILDTSRLQVF